MLSFRAFRHKKIVVKCIENYLNEAKNMVVTEMFKNFTNC